jgi:hypothetical protein
MPAPKRSMSKREAPVAIISMAQHAKPSVIGQSADLRDQLKSESTVVVMTDSLNFLSKMLTGIVGSD